MFHNQAPFINNIPSRTALTTRLHYRDFASAWNSCHPKVAKCFRLFRNKASLGTYRLTVKFEMPKLLPLQLIVELIDSFLIVSCYFLSCQEYRHHFRFWQSLFSCCNNICIAAVQVCSRTAFRVPLNRYFSTYTEEVYSLSAQPIHTVPTGS